MKKKNTQGAQTRNHASAPRNGFWFSAIVSGIMLSMSGAAYLPANAQTTPPRPNLLPVPNEAGSSLTISTKGGIDANNPFFKPMGNGRSCATCHQADQGWSISPEGIQAKFNQSNGLDPLFRLVDGANSPTAAVGTIDQKRLAYSMLLTKGLIRVGMPIPANAEFSLIKVDDPYGFASSKELSLFRRPLPTTNLKFSNVVMWDARETSLDANSDLCIKNARPARCFAPVDVDLLHQANSAVLGHAEASAGLTALEQRAIVDFETSLFTAQITSTAAGSLTVLGAKGGPIALSQSPFYFGINDVQEGDYKTNAPFTRNVMNMYTSWRALGRPAAPPARPGQPARPGAAPAPSATDVARASIARGEQLFNNRPFNIVNVGGFNDQLSRPLARATCSSCHSTPNAGTHSVPRLFNTGLADARRRTPDMPLYTLKNNATGEIVESTDPGLAMVTGHWADIGRFKTPSLRGLESRSPYFHNSSAEELSDVVRFYDQRFRMGLNAQERADLIAFLAVL
nr:Hypothetical protein Nit79A3_3156 [uncultured bacterium]